MKCKHVQELMGPYIYGDLAPDEMRQVRLHAQECAECREDLRGRGTLVSSFDNNPPRLTDEDRQRIAWSVKGVIRNEQERRVFRWWPVPALGLAAAVAVGLVVAKVVVRDDTGLESRTTMAARHKAIVRVTEDKGSATENKVNGTVLATEPRIERPRRRSRSIDIARLGNYIAGAATPATTSRKNRHEHKRNVVTVDSPAPIVATPEPTDVKPDVKTENSDTKLPKPTDLNDARTDEEGTGNR